MLSVLLEHLMVFEFISYMRCKTFWEHVLRISTVGLAVVNDQAVIRCRIEEHVHLFTALGVFSCVIGAGEGDIASAR